MTESEQVLLMVKGLISDLPEEQRAVVNDYIAQMELMLATNRAEAMVAIGYVGAQLQ